MSREPVVIVGLGVIAFFMWLMIVDYPIARDNTAQDAAIAASVRTLEARP